jgi:hypothetical protein
MKKLTLSSRVSRNKKIACTVSAAALMLGVSSAATIGLHFQCSYGCGNNPSYSGYPVTLTAFGVDPTNWENLLEMPTAYGACSFVTPGYSLEESMDTTTSTNGLNPLPNGSITVDWFANCANFDPFEGYQGILPQSPQYFDGVGGGFYTNTPGLSGEQEVYATFLRDGINYGPNASGSPAPYGTPDNPLMAYYTIDVTGLKSLFTNTPFVVELMASADSMNLLTNAFVTDVSNGITNSVTYPNTPPVFAQGDGGLWQRGISGGLSLASGVFSNTDHLHIASNIPQHGGTGPPPTGFDNAGTICGFILTDKPVISMYPQSIPVAGPGDTITLSTYVIGVPPLSLQWTENGAIIPGATGLSYVISNVNLSSGGNFSLVASNAYGVATSKVSTVTVDQIVQGFASNVVYDSNPDNPQNDGVNMGATSELVTNTVLNTPVGAFSFDAADSNGVTVADSPSLDGSTGTISFWMKSSGTDSTTPGMYGASLFCRIIGSGGNDFIIVQADGSPGNIFFSGPSSSGISFDSIKGVSDGNWHLVTLTFDQSASGGVGLYIDGQVDTTNANAANWSWTTGQPLEIGYSTDPTYREYNGLLSDVRYYSTILSATEINSIYTTGALVDPADLHMALEFASPPQIGYVLTWLEGSAVLQSAPSLSGPWTDLPNVASPYTIVPNESQQFFRYRYVPQTIESNPYLM